METLPRSWRRRGTTSLHHHHSAGCATSPRLRTLEFLPPESKATRRRASPTASASWTAVHPNIRSQVCPRPIPATSATPILKVRRQITRLLPTILASQKSTIRPRLLLRLSTASIPRRRVQDPSRSTFSGLTTQRALPPTAAVWLSNRTVRQCPSRMGETIKPIRSILTAMYL